MIRVPGLYWTDAIICKENEKGNTLLLGTLKSSSLQYEVLIYHLRITHTQTPTPPAMEEKSRT